MKYVLLLTLMIPCSVAWAQINPADSTAQIISYWAEGDKQTYFVRTDDIKLTGEDTTRHEIVTCNVDVVVKKEEKDSYLVEWLYYNVATETTNPLLDVLARLTDSMVVVFKTDEYGIVLELVNWQEIREVMQKGMATMREELGKELGKELGEEFPDLDQVFAKVASVFDSQQSIEQSMMRDIQQFHNFHGAKYKLGQPWQSTVEAPNMYGGEPFEAVLSVVLEDYDVEENIIRMQSTHAVNEEQLTNAAFAYINTLLKNTGANSLSREDVGTFANEVNTTSDIHGSGWVIASTQTTTVSGNGTSSITVRTILLE